MLKNKKTYSFLLLFIIPVSILFSFQNCGKFQSSTTTKSLSTSAAGKTTCEPSAEVNVCLFYKNPVVNRYEYPNSIAGSEIVNTHSGYIKPTENGFLSNENFSVSDVLGNTLNNSNNNWIIGIHSSSEKLQQLMAYYWTQAYIDYFVDKTKSNPLDQSGIQIVLGGSVTGWSFVSKKIYVANDPTVKYGLGFDAGALIHLITESVIAKNSNGEIYNTMNDTAHVSCGFYDKPVYKKQCCVDKNGCSGAITAGLADYSVSLLFPKYPGVGETLTQNIQGQSICNLTRNPQLNLNLSAMAAFNACGESGANGHIASMSILYASIWYSVRGSLNPADKVKMDKLFLALSYLLTGQDNFMTSLDKIQVLDADISNGFLYEKFLAEYNRRGLL